MADNIIQVILRSVDEMSADLKKVQDQLDGMGKATDQSSKAMEDMTKQSKETGKGLESLNTIFTTLGAVNTQFGQQMTATLRLLQALQRGLPIVAMGAFAALILKIGKDFADTGNELARFNKLTGISVETLSGLKLAADLNDSSLAEFGSGLRFFQRNLSSASRGVGETVNTFKDLGFTLDDLKEFTRNPEEGIERIAKSFQRLSTDAEKTEAAMRLFGRGGQQQIQILEDIANKGMKGLRAEAEKLGVLMTDKLAKAGKEFNDNLVILGKSLNGFAAVIAGPVVEAMNALIAKYKEWLSLENKTPLDERRKYIRARIDTFADTLSKATKRPAEEFKDLNPQQIGELFNKYPKERNLIQGLGQAYYEMADIVGKSAAPVAKLNKEEGKLHLTNQALREGIESLAKSLDEQVQSLETEIVKLNQGDDAALRMALSLKVAAFAADLYKKTGETISTSQFDKQIEAIVSLTAKLRSLTIAEQARQALLDKSKQFGADSIKAQLGDVAAFEAEMFKVIENIEDADVFEAMVVKVKELVAQFQIARESAEYLAKLETRDVERQTTDKPQDPNEARAKRLQFLAADARNQDLVLDKATVSQQSQLALLTDQLGILQQQVTPYTAILEVARQMDELEKGILQTEIEKKKAALEYAAVKLESKDISQQEYDLAKTELEALMARVQITGTRVRDMTADLARQGKAAAESMSKEFADTFINLLDQGQGGESFAKRLQAVFANLGKTLMTQGLTAIFANLMKGTVTEQITATGKTPTNIADLIGGMAMRGIQSMLGLKEAKSGAIGTMGERFANTEAAARDPLLEINSSSSALAGEFDSLALTSQSVAESLRACADAVCNGSNGAKKELTPETPEQLAGPLLPEEPVAPEASDIIQTTEMPEHLNLGGPIDTVVDRFSELSNITRTLGEGFVEAGKGLGSLFLDLFQAISAITGGSGGSSALGIVGFVAKLVGSVAGAFTGGGSGYTGLTGSGGTGATFGPGAAGGGLEFAAHGGIFTDSGIGRMSANQRSPYMFARGGMVTRGPVMGVVGEEGDEIVARMLPMGAGNLNRTMGGRSDNELQERVNIVLVDQRSKVPTEADIVMVIEKDMNSNGRVAKASTKLQSKRGR